MVRQSIFGTCRHADTFHQGVRYRQQRCLQVVCQASCFTPVEAPILNVCLYSGFASTQEAYESNYHPLHKSLARLDKLLKGKDYLIGDTLTEADVRLYTTIVRYDPVYTGHFKCTGSIRHDYPELNRWMKNLYWKEPAFKDTTDFDHIKVRFSFFDCGGGLVTDRMTPIGPLLLESSTDQPHQDCPGVSRSFPLDCLRPCLSCFELPGRTRGTHREAIDWLQVQFMNVGALRYVLTWSIPLISMYLLFPFSTHSREGKVQAK